MEQLTDGGTGDEGRIDKPARPGPDRAEVDALRRAVAVQRDLARRAAIETAERDRRLAATRSELRREQDRLAAFQARRSVRAAVGAERVVRAVARRVRGVARLVRGARVRPPADGREDLRAGPAEEAALRDRLRAGGASGVGGPAAVSGPLVSIVMLNRNGARHLRRCLPALAGTAYREIEMVVVDNGSSDDSLAVLEAWQPRFPVRILRNRDNTAFSDGNNQGIAASSGAFVLLLNNDIEPVTPDWLGFMVATAADPGVAAVGARLVYPRRTDAPRDGLRFPDLTLQHGGIHFEVQDGVPMPVPSGAGDDPESPWAAAVRDAPALTAACLLLPRADLDAVGGFGPGYDYGLEDVDLGVRLRARGGRLVYDGRAVLWHHESSTRVLDEVAVRRARRTANRDRFVATWAPRLYRTAMLDAIAGAGRWRVDRLRVGVDGATAPAVDGASKTAADGARAADGAHASGPAAPAAERVSAGARSLGWDVVDLGPDDDAGATGPALDVIVATSPERDVRTLPPGPVRVAWIPAGPEAWLAAPWLEDYDIVLAADGEAASAVERRHPGVVRASIEPVVGAPAAGGPAAANDDPSAPGGSGGPGDPLAAALAAALSAWVRSPRIAVRTGIPSWDVAPSWGDLHFARDLQRALRRRGRPVRLQLAPGWPAWAAAREDVAIHLLGLGEAPTHPGQLNVLWHISHPDRGTAERYGRYDLAFAASDSFADWMAGQSGRPVAPLHQAAEPARFRPGPTGPRCDLLFVANSRGVRRHILADLLPTDHDLRVYGRGWTPERLESRYLAGEGIANDDLGGHYAAAAIVLNDHWPDMQREGFLSNRLYDAAAAGAFVISDEVEGLDAEFDGGVVAYHGAAELRALVDWYLAHPGDRAGRADRARAAVLARHTFDHRAEAILAALAPLESARQLEVDEQPRAGPSGGTGSVP